MYEEVLQPEREHNHKQNWQGSSKAMKPALVVDLIKMVSKWTHLSWTMTPPQSPKFTRNMVPLRSSVTLVIQRQAFSMLCKVGTNHWKIPKHWNTIFTMFSYWISQRQVDDERLKSRLNQIVPHAHTHIYIYIYMRISYSSLSVFQIHVCSINIHGCII